MSLSSRPSMSAERTIEIVKDSTIDPAQFHISAEGRTLLIKNADDAISIYDLFVVLQGLGIAIDYVERV